MLKVGRVLYSLDFPPIVAVKIRKARIAGEFGMHNREINVISPRQCLAVKAGPADESTSSSLAAAESAASTDDDDKTLRMEAWVAADDEIDATGQRPAEGLTGLSSHDDVVPVGKGAEALEVSRQMPGQGVVGANDAVFGDRSD